MLVDKREQERWSRNYDAADALRAELMAASVYVDDDAFTWRCNDGRHGKVDRVSKQPDVGIEGRTVYVEFGKDAQKSAHLERELMAYFRKYGKVLDVRMRSKHRPSNAGRYYFAFVCFAKAESCDAAVAKKAHTISGRPVDVSRYRGAACSSKKVQG